MNISIVEPEKCTACGACYNICGHKAIEMRMGSDGFVYPTISEDKCTDCGLCAKVCCAVDEEQCIKFSMPQKSYAATNRNVKLRKASASGGVFSALATYFLNKGGIVVGCAFDENFNARHICIDNINDLQKLTGSKYMQSNIGNVYAETKKYLQSGRIVLFSGTPCQVAALLSFVGDKVYDNLFTVDLICHGVGSNELFKSYIRYREKKYEGKIVDYKFRSKRRGWGTFFSETKVEKGGKKETILLPAQLDYYYYYLRGSIYRPVCYKCKYAKNERVSDMTIGDFWGWKKQKINLRRIDGLSIVLPNTEKAMKLIPKLDLNLQETDLHLSMSGNGNLNRPTPIERQNTSVMRNLLEGNIEKEFERFDIVQKKDIRTKIKMMIPDCLFKHIVSLKKSLF